MTSIIVPPGSADPGSPTFSNVISIIDPTIRAVVDSRSMKHWILLLVAAAFEVGWVIGLRSFTFQRPLLASAIFASYVLSFVFLEKAAQGIPLGVAYAVWTGVGVVGAFAFGAAFLREKPSSLQIVFAVVVLIGVVGLYATSRRPVKEAAAPSGPAV